MEDTTLQILKQEVAVDKEDNSLQLILLVGIILPTANGPAGIPTHVYRVPLDRQGALELAKDLSEGGNQLKPESDIAVASSLHDVDRAAHSLQQFKG
jgi:hypothetical protein